MRVLCIDFETTHKDPLQARPWEFAACVATNNSWAFAQEGQYTGRMWAADYPELSPEIQRVCKLPSERKNFVGSPSTKEVLANLHSLAGQADYLMAYNAEYDRTVWEQECIRQKVPFPTTPWLCAYSDVPYPDYYRCRQLSHLALDHGIKVDPEALHGALGDVRLMGQLLSRGGYTLEKILEYKQEPWVYMKAVFNAFGPGGQELKEAAKADGYGWQQCRGDTVTFMKTWVKRVKLSKFEEEKARTLPFKRETLEA